MKVKFNETHLDNSKYLLHNMSNYKSKINNTYSEILDKFLDVFMEYFKLFSEKIKIKNGQMYNFIFQKGIETLSHVILHIFYYTKNLDLAYYYGQKGTYFYIEFIEQITDDNITFLQLTSKDATLFVYKKTIYEMNVECRKNMGKTAESDKEFLTILNTIVKIYKLIFIYVNTNTHTNTHTNTNTNKLENINLYCDSIHFIGTFLNSNKNITNKDKVDCILTFILFLNDKQPDIITYLKVIDNFNKKLLQKKNVDEKIVLNKLHMNTYTLVNDLLENDCNYNYNYDTLINELF